MECNKRSGLIGVVVIIMAIILFFILLLPFLIIKSDGKNITIPFEVEKTLSVNKIQPQRWEDNSYICNCQKNFLNSYHCLEELNFYSDKHYISLCGVHGFDSNITIYNLNNDYPGPSYTYRDLEKIFEFLNPCLDGWEPCTNIPTKEPNYYEEPGSVVCRHYVSVVDLLTICFSMDWYISGAFINSTILSRNDIMTLYHVTKDWVI